MVILSWTVSSRDDVQDVQVSREAWMPGATAAAKRTGMYLPRVMDKVTILCTTHLLIDPLFNDLCHALWLLYYHRLGHIQIRFILIRLW